MNAENVQEKAKETVDLPQRKDQICLVTVARLVEQKGIDRWIRVHSKLKKEGKNITVFVIGDGPLKQTLQDQIKKEGLQDSFYLLGKQTNPYPYIKMADYFCLFSYFEGYGMVLEEAKILNKPILITNTAAIEAVSDYGQATVFPNTEEGILEGLKQLEKPKEEIKQEYQNEERIEQIIALIGGE